MKTIQIQYLPRKPDDVVGAITLSETGSHACPYVTHFQNREYIDTHGEESGKSWGHYFSTLEAAEKDFDERVARGY